MTEAQVRQVVEYYTNDMPAAAGHEAEDAISPRLATAECACVATRSGPGIPSNRSKGVIRLDTDGSVSFLDVWESVPVETFYGKLAGGHVTHTRSVVRGLSGNTFRDASVRFEHPDVIFAIDRSVITSDDVLPLVEALKGFCGV